VVAELYMHNTLSKHRFAIIDRSDKYLINMSGDVKRTRITRDPGEEHFLPASTEDVERILANAELDVNLRDLDPPEEAELTDEQREQLEALGYLNEPQKHDSRH
jgi:predicted DNA binding protein